MEVIVLGSGVIGLTTAWYLRQAGHDVTVVDRQDSAAKETSFANAGQISYGYSSPWAAPGVPQKAMKWLFQNHAPLKINLMQDLNMTNWMLKMYQNCALDKYNVNKSRMLSIAEHSRQCLGKLNDELRLDYEGRKRGTLQVFRTQQQLEQVKKDMLLLDESGIAYSLLDPVQCISQEPGLSLVSDKIVGGLLLENDETGDCYKFSQELTKLAMQQGVKFLFDTDIYKLNVTGGSIVSVSTSQGELSADKYVVALGSYSAGILKNVGIDIPVYPVKGYSMTAPIIKEEFSPQSTVMDESYKVALTRFDNRIRVAGTAELTGFDTMIPEKRKETLKMVARDLFPRSADYSQAEFWTGLRPMTPDGTPIIGKTPIANLFTNTGHGTLGWTMACGSAQILSDIISDQSTEIDARELNVIRYSA